ncbi:MAG: hypothetical protein IJ664_07110 [Clostridia bacterium]|nr:hypothetical protein [Clostridia bacterium]
MKRPISILMILLLLFPSFTVAEKATEQNDQLYSFYGYKPGENYYRLFFESPIADQLYSFLNQNIKEEESQDNEGNDIVKMSTINPISVLGENIDMLVSAKNKQIVQVYIFAQERKCRSFFELEDGLNHYLQWACSLFPEKYDWSCIKLYGTNYDLPKDVKGNIDIQKISEVMITLNSSSIDINWKNVIGMLIMNKSNGFYELTFILQINDSCNSPIENIRPFDEYAPISPFQ